jgi:integrase
VFEKAKPAEFDRTIHDLRGTYVTWLAVKGLTDEQIARIVGWTARKVSQIRARYVDEARVVISLVDRLTA